MCLLYRIERYRAATAMPATTFGRRAVNDPRLVLDMRRGRVPGPSMIQRVEAFMAENPA
ncbi:hypothetical protein GCM10011380_07730 [Sphingomonas metalli]|jgi:hypothetical protein|uniref:Uncharacterized protein n=1 Tax=Sphingomonas metalli TaxID=1779358 RepID=A0A916WNY4_9SPHN|nr:hypothetical protein [Sphingomonas metalli]GGB20599.1 hypothetical protein GCM10011380_07730 [Sphingomonas metalli]